MLACRAEETPRERRELRQVPGRLGCREKVELRRRTGLVSLWSPADHVGHSLRRKGTRKYTEDETAAVVGFVWGGAVKNRGRDKLTVSMFRYKASTSLGMAWSFG